MFGKINMLQTKKLFCTPTNVLRTNTFKNFYGCNAFFCGEQYIELNNINKFRSCLANFTRGSHSLKSEKGRYYGVPREFRFCICDGIVEDEIRFLLICPLIDSNLDEVYIDDRFSSNANTWSFHRIMSCRHEIVIRNLAMFLYYAFKTRSEYIKCLELEVFLVLE